MKMITLDIPDMYVDLPIDGIIKTTKFWLNRNSSNTEQTKQQTLNVITTLIEQNYFQYNDKIYQPTTGITMGSPFPAPWQKYTYNTLKIYT